MPRAQNHEKSAKNSPKWACTFWDSRATTLSICCGVWIIPNVIPTCPVVGSHVQVFPFSKSLSVLHLSGARNAKRRAQPSPVVGQFGWFCQKKWNFQFLNGNFLASFLMQQWSSHVKKIKIAFFNGAQKNSIAGCGRLRKKSKQDLLRFCCSECAFQMEMNA